MKIQLSASSFALFFVSSLSSFHESSLLFVDGVMRGEDVPILERDASGAGRNKDHRHLGMSGKGSGKGSRKSRRPPNFDSVCLVEGTVPISGNTQEILDVVAECIPALFDTCITGYTSGSLDFSGFEDDFECLEDFQIAKYPLWFNRDSKSTVDNMGVPPTQTFTIQEVPGATNGEAYCAQLGMIAADKGTIESYNADILGTSTQLNSFTYDYFIASCGNNDPPCGEEMYLNIYTFPPPGSATFVSPELEFFGCRYDYVPDTANGALNTWYTAEIDPSASIGNKGSGTVRLVDIDDRLSTGLCPDSFQGAIDAGFIIGNSACFIWQLNVGDTAADNNNMIGCYDNIRVNWAGNPVTYDIQI